MVALLLVEVDERRRGNVKCACKIAWNEEKKSRNIHIYCRERERNLKWNFYFNFCMSTMQFDDFLPSALLLRASENHEMLFELILFKKKVIFCMKRTSESWRRVEIYFCQYRKNKFLGKQQKNWKLSLMSFVQFKCNLLTF